MSRHETVQCPEGVWTELTKDNATTITFLVNGPSDVFINVSTDAAPASMWNGMKYSPGKGEVGKTLAALAPGVLLGDRVWAFASGGSSAVFVSHD